MQSIPTEKNSRYLKFEKVLDAKEITISLGGRGENPHTLALSQQERG